MFTRFMDMHSGGGCKVKIDGFKKEYIYIELPESEAITHFEKKFNRHPENVTCDCCGEDYTIYEYETLEEATAFDRGDFFTKATISLPEYAQRDTVLIIYSKDIG